MAPPLPVLVRRGAPVLSSYYRFSTDKEQVPHRLDAPRRLLKPMASHPGTDRVECLPTSDGVLLRVSVDPADLRK